MVDGFRGVDWSEKRDACFQRDHFECRGCGRKDHLAAHHIIPWKFTQNNALYNLITVCPKCHMIAENQYRQFKKTRFIINLLSFNKEYTYGSLPPVGCFLPRVFMQRYLLAIV